MNLENKKTIQIKEIPVKTLAFKERIRERVLIFMNRHDLLRYKEEDNFIHFIEQIKKEQEVIENCYISSKGLKVITDLCEYLVLPANDYPRGRRANGHFIDDAMSVEVRDSLILPMLSRTEGKEKYIHDDITFFRF